MLALAHVGNAPFHFPCNIVLGKKIIIVRRGLGHANCERIKTPYTLGKLSGLSGYSITCRSLVGTYHKRRIAPSLVYPWQVKAISVAVTRIDVCRQIIMIS